MTIAPGTHLGRYEVRAPLGAGGMGEVYVAYDPDLDREVAIKVLRYGDESTDRVHRFIQEAKAASALNHPNVAHVYEIGSHDGLRFIVMEIVGGETLRSRIARGPLSVDDALDIALQVTAALAAAHKAGIIHRDIKPENIMIRPDGYAKVLDFGLAKLREPRAGDSATAVKTATGIAMGTMGYMAPEQLSGEHVTAAADVYSLGVVLYEMIHGVRPAASGLGPRDVPPKLNAIINKALSEDPKNRYPSAVEMHEDLRDISRAASVRAGENTGASLRTIGVVVAIVAVIAAAWFFVRAKRQKGAQQLITRAQQLFEEQRKLPAAYEVAIQAAEILPADDRLIDLMTKITQEVSIKTDPPGATVYLQRFKGPDTRERAGTTPLKLPRL
ncbi:MAG: serine/threonine-protein kinase, partial [Thermoanaerobaculia bacterium]